MDPDLFYPSSGESHAMAVEVCASCPVREQCRDYGMAEDHGIWGGLSERERQRVRNRRAKARRQAAAQAAAPPGRTVVHDDWLTAERRT